MLQLVTSYLKTDLKERLESFRKAVDLDPGFPWAREELAGALYAKGEKEQAFAQMKKAIELSPTYGSPYLGLGQMLEAGENCGEAIQCYAKSPKAVEVPEVFSRAHEENFSLLGLAFE